MATRSSKLYDDTTAVRVAIVGAGSMGGAQIGCEYALGGHEVALRARDPDGARARADAGFAVLHKHGLRGRDELAAAAAQAALPAGPELASDAELRDLAGVAITGGDLAGDAARRDAALARELEEERGCLS
jgi:3-hydroxyacyl-CoA dehydrogenase